ncbi:hypothetical protein GF348_09790 [candidate division KSB3 bacterium]|nr:hypothetical protein [candidate division KSB3 bacterium]
MERRLNERQPIKIVIGANGKYQGGWLPTEVYMLDITNPDDWARYFAENNIDSLLAEHVWEHLTKMEGIRAAELCHRYLRPGGYLRVAVPDGMFPDPKYIDLVKPGGSHASAKYHKVLYTYKTFRDIFESVDFDVELLEYFDEKGRFHYREWNLDEGLINRSARFYDGGHIFGEFGYRSIILDARKR